MDINEKFVITINRQFGTGGHEIGEAIAKRLGVKLIDKQILQSVAEKFNMTEDELKSVEDRRPSWWEDFAMFYKSFMTMNDFREDKKSLRANSLCPGRGDEVDCRAGILRDHR